MLSQVIFKKSKIVLHVRTKNKCIIKRSNAFQSNIAFYQKLQKTGSPQVQKAQTTELLSFIIY